MNEKTLAAEQLDGRQVAPGFNIRNIKISPGLVLAPMSGVTTSAFRRLLKSTNPGAIGLVVSEFISVEALTRQVVRSLEMMRFRPEERPVGIQIFGYDINRLRDAAMMVQDAGVDLIDLNCGCPAPKVVRKGGGCELMRIPDHLCKIVREIRRSVSIPFTIKVRAGWDEQSRNAVEIARMAESEGVDALTVHGRTRAQLYRGLADWDLVKEVARAVSIPVCGSGDVIDFRSAENRFSESGVAGVYIGRAALSNPFVFREILNREPLHLKRNPELMLDTVKRYITLLEEDFPLPSIVGKVKQLVTQMCKGHAWRTHFLAVRTFPELLDALKMAETYRDLPATRYNGGDGRSVATRMERLSS